MSQSSGGNVGGKTGVKSGERSKTCAECGQTDGWHDDRCSEFDIKTNTKSGKEMHTSLSFLIECWESERTNATHGVRGTYPDFRVVVRDMNTGDIVATSKIVDDFFDAVILRDVMFNSPASELSIHTEV